MSKRPIPLTDGSRWNTEPGPAAPSGDSVVDTSKPSPPQKSQDGAVFMGMIRPTKGAKKLVPQYMSKTQAEGAWNTLSEARKKDINDVAKAIDYRGTGESLFRKAINAAAFQRERGNDVTPYQIINSLLSEYPDAGMQDLGDGPGGGTRGRAPAYTGPVSSVTQAAESDIRASANAVAIELLGRGVTEDEFKKIEKRIRSAEMSQPQVTTRQGPGMQITEQGLSAQGREDILRQVLAKNPDFVDYQLDTTVMDLMLEDIERGKRVANV